MCYLVRSTKKFCKILNYIQHLLVLASTVTRCVSIYAFASLVGIPVGTGSSALCNNHSN